MTFGGSKWDKRSHGSNSQKWHKNDILLGITRKQSKFYLKIGVYYLLGSKQAKSDYFSQIGAPL